MTSVRQAETPARYPATPQRAHPRGTRTRGNELSRFAEAKLTPPAIRTGTVPKADVLRRVRPAARSTVALIVAPAGYGKTTILVELARQARGRAFAWVEIDEGDNDPSGFARCIGAALERSGAVDGALLRRGARPGDSHAVLTARLVRALKAAGPFALALDNLHLMTGTRSLKVVEAVANNLPPQSQLLVASRTRPRFGLTRLRAEGRLIELGTEDLRLSGEEALHLLAAAGADATVEEAAELNTRAEGWPAGLYLAALASAGGDPRLGSFDGSDRFVSDYFDAEHLSRLDEDDRKFLTRASVLELISGPLCDEVLGTADATPRLERIARSNLFVIGLGTGRPHVYRLQTMFREALAAELRRREPGRAETIAADAADWAARRGDLERAGDYAWAAGDRDRFAAIFDQAARSLFNTGRRTILERWLARLDVELLERHPAVAISGAFLHTLFGNPEEAEALAAVAEHAPRDTVMPDGTPSIEPWTAILRAAMCRAGKDDMRLDAARGLAGLAEGSPWRPTALMLLGVGQLLEGEAVAADEILAEAHIAAALSGSANIAAIAFAERSLLAAAEGRWNAAEALATSASDVLQEAQLETAPTSPLTFVASARSAVHRSDWVRARNDLEHACGRLPERVPAWLATQVHLEFARVLVDLSERDRATTVLGWADDVLAGSPDLGVLTDQAEALRRELERPAKVNGSGHLLTPAERRLLPLLTTHLTFREIGELLEISRNTVKTQAICTYRKLGVTSRSEAIERAIELGLVERPDALQAAAGDR
jgi:LuxR family transcriptional regulator, maltose regulon positive regulatory protein